MENIAADLLMSLKTIEIYADRAWDRAHLDDIMKCVDLIRQEARTAIARTTDVTICHPR